MPCTARFPRLSKALDLMVQLYVHVLYGGPECYLVLNNDVLLTALYPRKDMVVARFFKSDDQTTVTSIHFEKKGVKMVEINLDGKQIRNIDGKIDFKPWEIKTIQIK